MLSTSNVKVSSAEVLERVQVTKRAWYQDPFLFSSTKLTHVIDYK
jgi:hypothetical protein